MPPKNPKNRTAAPDKPPKGSVEGAQRGTTSGTMAGRQRGREAIEPIEQSKEANPSPNADEPHARTTTPHKEGSVEGASRLTPWQVINGARERKVTATRMEAESRAREQEQGKSAVHKTATNSLGSLEGASGSVEGAPHIWSESTPEPPTQGTMRSPTHDSNMDTSYTVLQATVVEQPNATPERTPISVQHKAPQPTSLKGLTSNYKATAPKVRSTALPCTQPHACKSNPDVAGNISNGEQDKRSYHTLNINIEDMISASTTYNIFTLPLAAPRPLKGYTRPDASSRGGALAGDRGSHEIGINPKSQEKQQTMHEALSQAAKEPRDPRDGGSTTSSPGLSKPPSEASTVSPCKKPRMEAMESITEVSIVREGDEGTPNIPLVSFCKTILGWANGTGMEKRLSTGTT